MDHDPEVLPNLDRPGLNQIMPKFTFAVIAAILLQPTMAAAWPCNIRVRTYELSLQWMPSLLQRLVKVWGPRPESVLCGAQAPKITDSASAKSTLRQMFMEVPERMYRDRDLAAYLDMMPRSAWIILELHDPTLYLTQNPYRESFYAYTSSHLQEIPNIIYGYPQAHIEADDINTWVQRIQQRTGFWVNCLRYPQRFGIPAQPQEWKFLDYRSPVYAMVSLSLQHAVTETVRFWFHIWKRGHGSLRGLPAPQRPGIFRMRTRSPFILKGR